MTFGSAARFTRAACLAALVGGIALMPRWAGDDRLAAAWAARGFFAMALPGIAGGALMARLHGQPGSGFVIALGSAFAVRLGLAGVATFAAQHAGPGAVDGLLAGLAAGFVPVTLLEMIWFAREARAQGLRRERHG